MTADKKKILLVEDETELRELYQILLDGEGYEVDACADGKEGLEAMEKGGYDLVLLDIMLPFIDGLEVLERAAASKAKNKQPNSSVVLLTNLAQDQTIARGLELGVRGYMIKSDYNPEQLLEAVADFLAQDD
ncbi:response regulator [bacterium]|nr:response regulator [bacterium]MBQ6436213.1 response regulator [bacterium]